MTLYDFCRVCKIPFEGSIKEPHRNDVEGFINEISIGETRKVSGARITSIHFPEGLEDKVSPSTPTA
mgnify:CR=1 FL=1